VGETDSAQDQAERGAVGTSPGLNEDTGPDEVVVPLAARARLTASDYFDVLSLILTYRPASSQARLGFALSLDELRRIRKRFEGWD